MLEFEEKVIKLLETINKKLDLLINAKPTTESKTTTAPAPMKTSAAPSSSKTEVIKPSIILEKQEEEKRIEEKPPVEGRRVCPNCGGTTFNAIEDRSQVMYQQGGMKIYAKKYICKTCGFGQ